MCRIPLVCLFFALCCSLVSGQDARAKVPTLVKIDGTLPHSTDQLGPEVIGVTFALYREPQGGAPLWLETQNVQVDADSRYTALLGSSKPEGLPLDLFASGEARWLGVQSQGQPEQPRVLLVSVPYAIKALDAETLGGLPASAFLTASNPGSFGSNGPSAPPLAGSGTPNHITKWITATKLGNSAIFETGAGKVGIGTTTPAAKFDLKGTGDVRDTLTLFPAGSHPALSISGTAFNINNTGAVTFVAGQTFPGTGTITGVTAGPGLTGGGTSGKVTLSMLTTCSSGQVLQWNGSTWICSNAGAGTVTSVGLSAPSSDFTVSGSPITGSGTLGLSWTVAPTSANTANAIVKRDGTGSFNVTSINGTGTFSTSTGNQKAISATSSNTKAAVIDAVATATTGFTIGVRAESNSVGSPSTGVWGIDQNTSSNHAFTMGVIGSSANQTGGIGVLGFGTVTSNLANTLLGSNTSGVWGDGNEIGVAATTDHGTGIFAESGDGIGAQIIGNGSAPGALVLANSGQAISAESVSGFAIEAITGDANTIVGYNDSASATIYGENGAVSGNGYLFYVTAPNVGNGATCYINTSAQLFCTGPFAGAVPLGSGRHVAMYSVQSPENWFEDFGSAHLAHGSATVQLDPTFAETANPGEDYHVFLTPRGECDGLYVANTAATGFEVRELHHGSSSVAFDYRIVAKRRGYENKRLEEVNPMAGRQEKHVWSERRPSGRKLPLTGKLEAHDSR